MTITNEPARIFRSGLGIAVYVNTATVCHRKSPIRNRAEAFQSRAARNIVGNQRAIAKSPGRYRFRPMTGTSFSHPCVGTGGPGHDKEDGWLFVALAGQFTTSLLFVIISASFLLLFPLV